MAKLEQQSIKPPPGQIKHDDHHIGTLDSSSYDTKGTADTSDDEMYFGDGNKPTNYNISVDDKTHIELGLKIHYVRATTLPRRASIPTEPRITTCRLAPRSSIPPTA